MAVEEEAVEQKNVEHEDVSTDDARQGETGHGVRYMLAFGLVFAVIAMGLTVVFAM